MQSFILPANGAVTPKSIERKRKMAEAMLQSGIDTSPVQHWTQGAARIAQALVGGMGARKADKQEAEGSQSAKEAMIKALNGGDKASLIDAASNPFMSNAGMSMIGDQWKVLNPGPADPYSLSPGEIRFDGNNQQVAEGAPKVSDHQGEMGLQPVFWKDANGKLHAAQLSKGGGMQEVPLPQDGQWAPGVGYLDTATGFVPYDKRGGIMPGAAEVPKDLAGAEAQKEIGTASGKATAAAPADMQAADNALSLIDQIATDPNLDWGVGATSLGNVIPGTPGRDFQSRVDQAKSGAFLSAIQQLRGMGSLSNAEGDTATKAVTRLNTATSKEEFLSALDDYRKIVQIGKARAASRLGPQAQPIPQPMPQGVPDVSTMSDQDLEAIINGP